MSGITSLAVRTVKVAARYQQAGASESGLVEQMVPIGDRHGKLTRPMVGVAQLG
jgi:hypothetical protein